MVQNGIRTPEELIERARHRAFPEPPQMLSGYMGQPPALAGGAQRVVPAAEAITVRPGELLPPIDFEAKRRSSRRGWPATQREVLSEILFPGRRSSPGTVRSTRMSVVDTPPSLRSAPGRADGGGDRAGKTIIKLMTCGSEAQRHAEVLFELNGCPGGRGA